MPAFRDLRGRASVHAQPVVFALKARQVQFSSQKGLASESVL
jgi:hypothetical protein